MPRNDTNFWYGKNVLITGGDGFVASNLAATLIQRSANVTITLRHQRAVPTLKLLGKGDDVVPDMEFSDLSDFLAVQRLCNRHKIDTIFHLAASAIVSDASRSPISTFENNFLSTLNILETARINQIPRVLFASSDKSYGDHADADDPERIPYREDHALRGLDVYSASKVCADMMCQTYAFQFQLPVIVVRSCNIYGPGDLNFTRLIPRTILRLRSDSVPVINAGNSEVLREYIYVDDLVEAYSLLAQHTEKHYKGEIPKKGRATYGWSAYNVGSYQGSLNPKDCPNIRNVSQVIHDIMQKMGKTNLKPQIIPKDVNFIEIPDQYLDASKIMKLGYKTKVSWNEGLERSIKWYLDNGDFLSRLGSSYIK
jgi:CDP-glucose 4,6-dehydratase